MPSTSTEVLLIEDDEQFVEILTRILRSWPVEITTTSIEAEAMELLTNSTFGLVLIDLKLGENDAFRLLNFVGALPQEVKDRCLIVTGFPLVSRAWSELPVIDKWRLGDLGPHLYRILGTPPATAARLSDDERN